MVGRRRVKWKPLALLAALALAWWCYAAPGNVAKRLRASTETALLADRIDFASVNAQLSGDLKKAVPGGLNAASFTHLLLYGWLPQQRPKTDDANVPRSYKHTRIYQVRYKSLNRVLVMFWDINQFHQVALTLERDSVFHRWHVTRVTQYNFCAYEFDCKQIPLADIPAAAAR